MKATVIQLDALKEVCPHTPAARLDLFVEPLNATFSEFSINTPARQAAFLAQVAHESMGFQRTREIWGPTTAQEGYEGRQDLGNINPGDGKRYMGRGLIQITGRANYYRAGTALGEDFIASPELLERPDWAARSAGWFWSTHGLNLLADAGKFEKITRRINGGLNGQADRISYHALALKAVA